MSMSSLKGGLRTQYACWVTQYAEQDAIFYINFDINL